jgi:hypothetical protein
VTRSRKPPKPTIDHVVYRRVLVIGDKYLLGRQVKWCGERCDVHLISEVLVAIDPVIDIAPA